MPLFNLQSEGSSCSCPEALFVGRLVQGAGTELKASLLLKLLGRGEIPRGPDKEVRSWWGHPITANGGVLESQYLEGKKVFSSLRLTVSRKTTLNISFSPHWVFIFFFLFLLLSFFHFLSFFPLPPSLSLFSLGTVKPGALNAWAKMFYSFLSLSLPQAMAAAGDSPSVSSSCRF